MARVWNLGRLLPAAALSVFVLSAAALAHRPVLERSLRPGGTWESAAQVADPTHASTAAYGRLDEPGEVDFYKFTAAKAETIPVEALVPVRPSNADFRPTAVVLGRHLSETPGLTLPFPLPEGFRPLVVHTPEGGRAYFYEPYSLERLYRGGEARVPLVPGETYYVAVYEPRQRTGSYTLGVGTAEQFEDVSKVGLVWNVLAVKLGLAGARRVPWLDVLATFVALAGLALGFGATAFSLLVELSSGGDPRAARPQAVATNLAWPGLFVALAGSALLYRESMLSGVAPFQAALAVPLVLAHLYLFFRLARRARRAAADVPGVPPPPAAKRRLILSHALSLLCWAGCLLLLVWHALVLR
jgi:hypothetical protein